MNEIFYEDIETLPSFTPRMPTFEIYNYRRFSTSEGVSYFVEAKDIDPTQSFESYDHIDPLMRGFVYLMHISGLFVSSGWEGVEDPKVYFDNLKMQEQKIQKSGIQIIDFLTGKYSEFKDKSYRSPFETFEDFISQGEIIRYDHLGLLVPVTNTKTVKNLSSDPYETGLTTIQYKEDLDINGIKFAYFPILVRREDDKSRTTEWRNICSWVLSHLEKKAVLDASYFGRKS